MKSQKVIAREGTFQHYLGPRRYVMVALSEYSGNQRILAFSVAICNPVDKFDFDLGQQIALNKLKHFHRNTRIVVVSHYGMINKEFIEFMLAQEMQAFERKPGAFIANYFKDEQEYYENLRLEEVSKSLTKDERAYIDTVRFSSRLEDLNKLVSRSDLV